MIVCPNCATSYMIDPASVGPTGAAIGNALARALGKRVRDLPLTRERIMSTLLAE